MSKWFICQNEHVTGPFTSEQVQAKLRAAEVLVSDMIFGRGMSGWQSLRWWTQELPKLKVSHSDETVQLETWHYALAGKSHGPFTRSAMVADLKHVAQLGEVMLWTKGMKEWAHLFEFHDILTELGVNKRQFPRAEIQGQVLIKADGRTLSAPLLTISETGLGAQLEGGLVSGQQVTLEVQSEAFRNTIHARADVRYVSNGIVGFKFTNISSESKGQIVALVRQITTRFNLRAA